MHTPFVKQMLNSWSVCNRIIPNDWIELVKAVLEPGPQLQWSRQEAKIIEPWSKVREVGKFPKIKFLEKETMLLHKGRLYMMPTPRIYSMKKL